MSGTGPQSPRGEGVSSQAGVRLSPGTAHPSGIRVAPLDERRWEEFVTVGALAFGQQDAPAVVAAERELLGDRALVALDTTRAGEPIVGCAGWFALRMVVPGGAVVPCAGVTYVSVLPTHRRRGVLTAMMTTQLADLAARGQPVAALRASETAIYGRFGYGLGTQQVGFAIPRAAGQLAWGPPPDQSLQLRLVDVNESRADCDAVYGQVALRRAGTMLRDEAWSRYLVLDDPADRRGMSALRVVLAQDDRGLRGYARYRVDGHWQDGMPAGTVTVEELVAVDPPAQTALWRYLLDLDLTTRVQARARPLDDALLHQLADPRSARPVLRDGLYVRVIDVLAALTARAYSTPVDVVIELADPILPANSGRWHLRAERAGRPAVCERTEAPAGIRMGIAELGAAYLGGTSLAALARAGRVQAADEAALTTASYAFRTDPEPFSDLRF